jgi:hypothetical protein
MLVDCDNCAVRGPACGECLVGVVLGAPPAGVDLDDEERRALRVLADAGMVPELRLVHRAVDPDDLPCGYLPVEMSAPAARPLPRCRSRRSAA